MEKEKKIEIYEVSYEYLMVYLMGYKEWVKVYDKYTGLVIAEKQKKSLESSTYFRNVKITKVN